MTKQIKNVLTKSWERNEIFQDKKNDKKLLPVCPQTHHILEMNEMISKNYIFKSITQYDQVLFFSLYRRVKKKLYYMIKLSRKNCISYILFVPTYIRFFGSSYSRFSIHREGKVLSLLVLFLFPFLFYTSLAPFQFGSRGVQRFFNDFFELNKFDTRQFIARFRDSANTFSKGGVFRSMWQEDVGKNFRYIIHERP